MPTKLAEAVALKVALVAPAATVTEAGTVSADLLLASVTFDPPAGAICVKVTVQVLDVPGPTLGGLHARPETRTGAIRLIAAVCELGPSVAVTVAPWLLAIEAPAVALKFAVLVPGAIVTDAGTISKGLLLLNVTLEPPARAAWVSVTVQLLVAFCPRLAGLHARADTRTGANRLIAALCEPVPRAAVTVAL